MGLEGRVGLEPLADLENLGCLVGLCFPYCQSLASECCQRVPALLGLLTALGLLCCQFDLGGLVHLEAPAVLTVLPDLDARSGERAPGR